MQTLHSSLRSWPYGTAQVGHVFPLPTHTYTPPIFTYTSGLATWKPSLRRWLAVSNILRSREICRCLVGFFGFGWVFLLVKQQVSAAREGGRGLSAQIELSTTTDRFCSELWMSNKLSCHNHPAPYG